MQAMLNMIVESQTQMQSQRRSSTDDKSPLPLDHVFLPIDGLRATSPLVEEGWADTAEALNAEIERRRQYSGIAASDHQEAYMTCEVLRKLAGRRTMKAPVLPDKEHPVSARRRCAATASAAL